MTITSTVRCVTTNGEKNRQKKSRPNAQSADRWAITSKMKEAWMGMSDTKVLWELCRHGRGPSHYYSIDEAGASQGNLRCPGGEKVTFRRIWWCIPLGRGSSGQVWCAISLRRIPGHENCGWRWLSVEEADDE